MNFHVLGYKFQIKFKKIMYCSFESISITQLSITDRVYHVLLRLNSAEGEQNLLQEYQQSTVHHSLLLSRLTKGNPIFN